MRPFPIPSLSLIHKNIHTEHSGKTNGSVISGFASKCLVSGWDTAGWRSVVKTDDWETDAEWRIKETKKEIKRDGYKTRLRQKKTDTT